MRRLGDPVLVKDGPDSRTGGPDSFLWKGRLYVVREVLGHWRERCAWWLGGEADAVHGVLPGEAPASATGEREIWRVEAGAGRVVGTGVYDLCLDLVPSSGGAPAREWSLVQVSD